MPINQADLPNLKPRDKVYRIPDGGGLFIEVLTDGSMFWRLRYQLTTKEKVTLGRYPKYSLAEARQWRTECAELISLGVSPKALKRGDITPTELNPKEKKLANIFLNNWCWSVVEKMKINDVKENDVIEDDEITLETFAKNLDKEIAEQAKNNPVEIDQVNDLTVNNNPDTKADTTPGKTSSNILKRLFSFGSAKKK